MSRPPPEAGSEPGRAGAPAGGCSLLLILLAAVWVASIGLAGGTSRDFAHPLSIESGDPGAKALRPHASVLWRNPSSLRKEGGAAQPKSASCPGPAQAMVVAAHVGRPTCLPQPHQSFLTCRTWNPRAPPLARG